MTNDNRTHLKTPLVVCQWWTLKSKAFVILSFVILVLVLGFSFSNIVIGQNLSPSTKGELKIVNNSIGLGKIFYYRITPTPSIFSVISNGTNSQPLDEGKYKILETLPSNNNWVMRNVSCFILPPPPPPPPPPSPPPSPPCDNLSDTSSDCRLEELENSGGGVKTNDLTYASQEYELRNGVKYVTKIEPKIGGFHYLRHSIWYKFKPKVDKKVIIDTCASSTDTVMSLRKKSTDFFGTEVAFDDDSCAHLGGSKITYNVTAKTDYYLVIDYYDYYGYDPEKPFRPIILTFTDSLSPRPPSPPPPPPLPPPGEPTGKRITGKNGIEDVGVVKGKTTVCTFENEQVNLKITTKAIGGNGKEKFNYNIEKFSYFFPLNNYRPLPYKARHKLNVETFNKIKEDDLRGDEYMGSDGIFLGDNEMELEPTKVINSYTVSQEVPDGWALNSVVCQLENGTKIGTPTIYKYGIENLFIKNDRVAICTFTNTKKGEIKIVKNVIGMTASPTSPGQPPPPQNNEFDYDVNFLSTDYLSSGLLPFYIKPTGCADRTCSLDEDCNICKIDCQSCNAPPPKEPGPGYSPTRITAKPDSGDYKKRVYPGAYEIIERTNPTLPGQTSWLLNNINCQLENGDKTGTKTGRGINNLKIYAGKTTTCTSESALSVKEKSGGVRRKDAQQEPKPDYPF